MAKQFLLIFVAWLFGYAGPMGVMVLLTFFLAQAYLLRYRGYYGRLSDEEVKSLRLDDEATFGSMAPQGDVIPSLRGSKHVISKWTWDRIALNIALQAAIQKSENQLAKAYERIIEFTVREGSKTTKSQYGGTLSVIDPEHSSHSPASAIALLQKVYGEENQWSDKALVTLGGALVIIAEGYKNEVKQFYKENNSEVPRMNMGTAAEISRITWKMGQLYLNPGLNSFRNFIKAVLSRVNPWDQHAVIEHARGRYYAPTTMFGASATMMKVLNLGRAAGLEDDQMVLIGYCVSLHWIDKYLNDDSWFRGGKVTPDRHSLIEALQGMCAHIDGDPELAAGKLVALYKNADAARTLDGGSAKSGDKGVQSTGSPHRGAHVLNISGKSAATNKAKNGKGVQNRKKRGRKRS